MHLLVRSSMQIQNFIVIGSEFESIIIRLEVFQWNVEGVGGITNFWKFLMKLNINKNKKY
jgi:hypothetical protein